jgi:chromosomal replication initiator protein
VDKRGSTIASRAAAEELWARVGAAVRQQLNDRTWDIWFQGVRALDLEDECLTLAVPNPMAAERIRSSYAGMLDDAALALTGLEVRFDLVVQPDGGSDDGDDDGLIDLTALDAGGPAAVDGRTAAPAGADGDGKAAWSPGALNPRYTFDEFVIGPTNAFAHAAALAVAEHPARSYNPLFLYGPAGLGKTHLLQAIGHHSRQLYSTKRMRYVSTERMMNEFVDAMRTNAMTSFKRRYREVDVLLMDDIQFLERTTQLQEEFFHTFNELHARGSQIVISSDRPPRSIATLEDRLRSRFEWGLITDIQPPEFETRLAILRKKAQSEQIEGVPDDVLSFIASHVVDNVRMLEGSLTRIAAYSSLHRVALDADRAKVVLADLLPSSQPRPITPTVILAETASMFGWSVEDLTGPSRRRPLVNARQISMYVFRELTDYSYPRIAEVFGGRDHTTVMHACDKVRSQIAEKPVVFNQVNELINRIKHGAGG